MSKQYVITICLQNYQLMATHGNDAFRRDLLYSVNKVAGIIIVYHGVFPAGNLSVIVNDSGNGCVFPVYLYA